MEKEKTSLYNDVINFISKNPGQRTAAVRAAFSDCPASSVDGAIKRAYAAGVLIREVSGEGFFLYSVAEANTDYKARNPINEKYSQAVGKAVDLERRGLFNRAGVAWLGAMQLAVTERERDMCANRRRHSLSIGALHSRSESRNSGHGGVYCGILPTWMR
ncbi:ANR family transcriptional regulator [Salmonella enterica]|uniref:ANR family transcriptional regulator n=1 Tax=Salmonella enterica TaxID=28901 RepID=UPI0026DA72E0|nr:ANR family transcriptional regulator [Salmonella enterica]MDO3920407.1 ANR family transcriptional regulator [Salmonella enterica]